MRRALQAALVGLAVSVASCDRAPNAQSSTPPSALDRPIMPAGAPTVRSEIRRGWAAGYGCVATADSRIYDACVDHLEQTQSVDVADARPYELGLRLRALRIAADQKESAPDASTRAVFDSDEILQFVKAYGLMSAAHLTQQEVFASLPDGNGVGAVWAEETGRR